MIDIKTLSLERFQEFLTGSDTIPIETAYNEVAWFRRGIDIRTEAVRAFPFSLMRGDNEIASNAPESRVDIPPELNIFPIVDDLSADIDLYGAAYAIYETNAFNRNGAWRRLHPKTVRPKFDDSGLAYFERTLNGKQFRLEVEDVLYVWTPNRAAEIGPGNGVGYSALHAATALNNITKFQTAFFENGALNPTIVTVEGFQNFPQEEQDRIRNRFQRLMSGIKNAFQVIPVAGNTTVTSLMQNISEMSMDMLTTQQRENIATALGVPHSLLFSNAANYATANQDDLNFYDKAVVPHVRMIESQLNERLFIPRGYRLDFKPGDLEVYQQLESNKVDKLNGMLDRNVITIDEYREMMGLPPREHDIEEDEPEQDDEPDNVISFEDMMDQARESQNGQAQEEMRKWRTMAVKRYKEGSPEKALDFDTDVIPSVLYDKVLRTLEQVKTIDGVFTVFDDAAMWLEWPA